MNPDKVAEVVRSKDKSTVFVTSRVAGLGKTHYILRQAGRDSK